MRVLLVGSGGREHALALALSNSPSVTFLLVAPGNPGIAEITRMTPIGAEDVPALVNLAVNERIDLVVVGPEAALAAGIADALAQKNIACFGPSKAAAQLESSKAFTKTLCEAKGIPTAAFATFESAETAMAYLDTIEAPYVIKADGLAAGKGVVIAPDGLSAKEAIHEMFDGRFGSAGTRVVIEEFMTGEEVSFFALCDGKNAIYLGSAQDHKRAFDGERGPNTGGMGAYSPTRHATPAFVQDIMARFIEPTLVAMTKLGMPFCGVLYAGLMLTPTGPKLVEYNARFGDPECQVLMARFEGDLARLLMACAQGKLESAPSFRLADQTAALVVMAAQGYPDDPIKGSEIRGEMGAKAVANGVLLHAGTRRDEDGKLRAAGGRVLNAIGLGPTLQQAVDSAYQVVDAIDWPMGFHRRDIGWRELNRDR
ncbi:phosphoribosylamine--glycine ligase [Aquidulcibacter paucihalophilus]|uniref:phosphoribosylamine--glycine ligase n=1 Tax=Aquidulcibacter paucihalophilus TaxID=1978549 RepID=UPI000A1928A5|nr:phosphoribosylamine--glycine ligase [Aquidulcibacter paucihalophilus]